MDEEAGVQVEKKKLVTSLEITETPLDKKLQKMYCKENR